MHSIGPRALRNGARNFKRSADVVAVATARPIRPILPPSTLPRAYSAGPASSIIDNDEGQASLQASLVDETKVGAPPDPRDRADPAAWLALIEPYLPIDLRANLHGSTSKATQSPDLEPISTLPALLARTRTAVSLKLDPLSYLGVHEHRWNCVIWLVKRLLEERESTGIGTFWTYRQRPSPWVTDDINAKPLDEITKDRVRYIFADHGSTHGFFQSPSHGFLQSLDETTASPASPTLRHGGEGLGQVWASTANMILQATDLPEADTNRKIIMSHALEIIAHLHHIDALPRSIYTYSHPVDASVIRKPPTLYLLAYRMMTILSDSAWKAQDLEIRREAQVVGARDWYKGHEVPGPAVQPRVNELGSEVWLDLILWCCIEGGWITEAADIVMEMAKRKNKLRWKAIDFRSMSEPAEPKLNWSARVELEIARSRMNQISGINIAGQSGSPPFVEMGPRTVSKEVILALMDALSYATISSSEFGSSPTTMIRSLRACRAILGGRSVGAKDPSLNRSILGMFESGSQASAGDLERLLEMTPSYQARSESAAIPITSQRVTEELSAAGVGLLHRNIYQFAVEGNVQGALRAFNKMQNLVDINRRMSIQEFAEALKRREQADNGEDDLLTERINNLIPGVHSKIPIYVLVSLLDLVTKAGPHDFGTWLLFSEEVDGPWIPQSLFAEPALQPVLLRFAEATVNGELFAQISSKLEAPLSPEILRTLLHCQIALGKWDAAEEIFSNFQSDESLGLIPEDIMSVARAILRLETAISEDTDEDVSEMSDQLRQASTLLQGILRGEYLPDKDPSQPRDYTSLRVLTQIGRIFKSIPGSLSEILLHTFGSVGRANAAISTPTEAFNILLEGVAEAYGSSKAELVWNKWCHPILSDPNLGVKYLDDGRELVVTPSLQTLRVMMRPIVRGGRVANSHESGTVEWARQMCYRFGLTEKEIYNELPGLIPKPKRPGEEEND